MNEPTNGVQRALGRLEATQAATLREIQEMRVESKEVHTDHEERIRSTEKRLQYAMGMGGLISAIIAAGFATVL